MFTKRQRFDYLWKTRGGNRLLTAGVVLVSAAAAGIYSVFSRFIPSIAFHDDRLFHCPGCGGTRMVRCLLAGDWMGAVYYHPLFLAALLAGIVWLIWSFLRTFRKDWKPLRLLVNSRWWLLLPIVLIGFTLIRNTPFYQQYFY